MADAELDRKLRTELAALAARYEEMASVLDAPAHDNEA